VGKVVPSGGRGAEPEGNEKKQEGRDREPEFRLGERGGGDAAIGADADLTPSRGSLTLTRLRVSVGA
jgi:hypothetical protein